MQKLSCAGRDGELTWLVGVFLLRLLSGMRGEAEFALCIDPSYLTSGLWLVCRPMAPWRPNASPLTGGSSP